MTTTVNGITLELTKGNIADQADMDAVVNAANAQLQPGGGVAGAIHDAAGPGLAEEARAHAPLQPGEAATTGAHDLPNEVVIHVLGPVYGRDEPSDALLRAAYENALHEAEAHGCTSVALPALSTGAFGFPMKPAAEIAIDTILEKAHTLASVQHVRLVLFDEQALRMHEDAWFERQEKRA